MSNIPIGAKLRLQRITASTLSKSAEPNQKEAVTVRSLDDEIVRLEAELNAGSGSDPTESDKDESEDSEAMETEETAGVVAVKSSTGRVLALKSALDDRIQSLPAYLLPMANCTKADKSRPFVATKVRFQELDEPRPLKRARVVEHEGRKEGVGIHRPAQQKLASTGLSKTVQELIRSYVPASHEKKAFYCRCCQYEGSSEEDFFSHRESPVHHAAVELERKASFCRLCRKQFTSPEQIKEHLKGKAHKQNLELMSRNNQSRTAAGVKLDRI